MSKAGITLATADPPAPLWPRVTGDARTVPLMWRRVSFVPRTEVSPCPCSQGGDGDDDQRLRIDPTGGAPHRR